MAAWLGKGIRRLNKGDEGGRVKGMMGQNKREKGSEGRIKGIRGQNKGEEGAEKGIGAE